MPIAVDCCTGLWKHKRNVWWRLLLRIGQGSLRLLKAFKLDHYRIIVSYRYRDNFDLSYHLGDRQRSHPVKNPASIFWQVFRGVARCCLPRFQGQPQHLKYQNRILKKKLSIENSIWHIVTALLAATTITLILLIGKPSSNDDECICCMYKIPPSEQNSIKFYCK